MDLPIEALRLKEIREELRLTQSAFAQILETGSTTADIERGRTRISGIVVKQLLSIYHINPLWLYGESNQKHLDPYTQHVNPQTISIDNTGKENILLVNEKAAAGYAGNLGDPEYYQNLPAFTFPLPAYRNGTFRGFQVEGNSMSPALLSGEWIITEAVSAIKEISNGQIYVIVDKEGLRVKRVTKDSKKNQLLLISINTEYPMASIPYDEVIEVWAFHSKISQEISNNLPISKLDAIHQDIKAIKASIG